MTIEQTNTKPYSEMTFEERIEALRAEQSELTRGAARRRRAWNAERAKRNGGAK